MALSKKAKGNTRFGSKTALESTDFRTRISLHARNCFTTLLVGSSMLASNRVSRDQNRCCLLKVVGWSIRVFVVLNLRNSSLRFRVSTSSDRIQQCAHPFVITLDSSRHMLSRSFHSSEGMAMGGNVLLKEIICSAVPLAVVDDIL